MARLYQRWCRIPGCNQLTRDKSGYCQAHKKGHRKLKGDRKQADPFYVSSQWKKFRKWFLTQEPICQVCQREPATTIHHLHEIKAGGDPLLVSNCQAVCAGCHNRIHHSGNHQVGKRVYRYGNDVES
jgi:5-methylcytosine-specific restriction enzyme A